MKILRPDIHKKLVDGTYTIKNWHRFNSEIAIQMMAENEGITVEEYEKKYRNNSGRYGESIWLIKTYARAIEKKIY